MQQIRNRRPRVRRERPWHEILPPDPRGEAMNAGHIYVQLGRLEKAGLVADQESTEASDGPDRKVCELTPVGQERVAEWVGEVTWPKPDLAEFHLKLVVAAQARLADPVGIVDAQRAAMSEPGHSPVALLLEGIVLRLQAELRWLEACERASTEERTSR